MFLNTETSASSADWTRAVFHCWWESGVSSKVTVEAEQNVVINNTLSPSCTATICSGTQFTQKKSYFSNAPFGLWSDKPSLSIFCSALVEALLFFCLQLPVQTNSLFYFCDSYLRKEALPSASPVLRLSFMQTVWITMRRWLYKVLKLMPIIRLRVVFFPL